MREGKITLGDLTQIRNKHIVQSQSLSTEKKSRQVNAEADAKGHGAHLAKPTAGRQRFLALAGPQPAPLASLKKPLMPRASLLEILVS